MPKKHATIEYSIVALGLSATELAVTVKDVTGVSVDPEAAKPLETLSAGQLDAVKQRLLEHPGWGKRREGAEGQKASVKAAG
ncbi:MAG: hypothetical protein ABI759_25595 [Candidatus Solibacter sp.]